LWEKKNSDSQFIQNYVALQSTLRAESWACIKPKIYFKKPPKMLVQLAFLWNRKYLPCDSDTDIS